MGGSHWDSPILLGIVLSHPESDSTSQPLEGRFPPRQKRCPDCGEMFECCGSGTGWCGQVHLHPQTREKIKENFSDCLCPTCLDKWNNPEPQT